jgi:hypothetical protein
MILSLTSIVSGTYYRAELMAGSLCLKETHDEFRIFAYSGDWYTYETCGIQELDVESPLGRSVGDDRDG